MKVGNRVLCFALAATLLSTGCSVAPTPTAPPATGAAKIARERPDLAVLPGEGAVLAALNAGGLQVKLIGTSKYEAQLGPVLPARVFIVTNGAEGADVLFLPAQSLGDVRVCLLSTKPGLLTYQMTVDGKPTTAMEAVAPLFYSLGRQYLSIAYDGKTRDALEKGLGLSPVRC